MIRRACGRLAVLTMTLCVCIFVVGVRTASASHFRGGTIYWQRVLPDPSPGVHQVTITMVTNWRWSYPYFPSTNTALSTCPTPGTNGFITTAIDMTFGSCPTVGSIIQIGGGSGNGQLTFSTPVVINGATVTSTPHLATVVSVVPSLDAMYSVFTTTISFPATSNPVQVTFTDANRLSSLLDNNNDIPWQLSAVIDLSDPVVTKSPESTMSPIVSVNTGVQNTVQLSSVAFDNMINQFRFATAAESGLVTLIPPGMTLTASGLITFTPPQNGLYVVQFMITSYDTNGIPHDTVPLEILFNAITCVSCPSLTVSATDTSFATNVNQSLTVPITATVTNPPASGGTISITSTPLLSHMTISNTNGAAPSLTATVNWTPQLNDSSGAVCFQATYEVLSEVVTSQNSYCINFNIGALQTTLTMPPVSGFAGDNVSVSATLTRTLDNAPLINKQVVFAWADAPEVPLATPLPLTNNTGTATITVPLIDIGTRQLQATFIAIANEFLASSTTSAAVIAKGHTTRLTNVVAGTNPYPTVGFPSQLSSELVVVENGNPAQGQPGVNFTITPPVGGPTQLSGPTTDTNGVSTLTFTPTTNGAYSAYTSFDGNANLYPANQGGTPAVSATTTLTVFQRVQMSVAAASGVAGAATTVTAQLTAIPSGVGLSGRSVTLNFGSGASAQTVVTDANGNASATVVFPSAGSFTTTASYNVNASSETNSNGLLSAETATSGAAIVVAATALTAPSIPSTVVANTPQTVSSMLVRTAAPAGPINGQSVTFALTAPGGAVFTLTGTTDSTGAAMVTVPSSQFSTPGTYTMVASFAAPSTPPVYASSVSPTVSIQVVAVIPTQITLPPLLTTSGTPTAVGARLTNALGGTGITGVTIAFSASDGESLGSVVTDSTGTASLVWVPGAAFSGQYTATFAGMLPYAPSSASNSLTVALAATSFSALSAPASVRFEDSITASATLIRTTAPSGPVVGVPVVFTLAGQAPNAPTTTQSVTSANDGSASITFPGGMPPGPYVLTASYAGSGSLAGATASVTVMVGAAVPVITVTGATAVYDGQPHPATATAIGLDGNPVNGLFAFTYMPGGPSTPVAAGSYAVSATFTSQDPDYANAAANGSWTPAVPLSAPRVGTAAGVINQKLYVVGGCTPASGGCTNPNENDVFDPVANMWTVGSTMPTARSYAGAGVIGNALYVAGGCLNGDCTSTTAALERYDPASDTWSSLLPMPTARAQAAIAAVNGLLVVAGGFPCASCPALTTVEAFDSSANTWTTASPLPAGQSGAVGVAVNGIFYAIGGTSGSTFAYNPASNTWTMKSPMLTARSNAAGDVLFGSIYIVGGASASAPFVTTAEAYDPVADSWVSEPNMTTPRASLAASSINNVLYAVGGQNATGALATTETFAGGAATVTITPATPTVTWATPSSLSYGMPLGGQQLNATASVAGTFAYSPPVGTVLAARTQTLSVIFTPADANDQTSVSTSVLLTVTPAMASVTPNAASKTYGSGDPLLTGTLVGFLGTDNVTATYTRAVGETVLGGPYAISATLGPANVLSNYAITYNTANFTIGPATASVTPNAASKTYGTPDPTLTGTLSGFVATDDVTPAYTRAAGETVLGGPYTISATLGPANVLGNYAITYNTANFTISPATASVTPNAASKTYGTPDQTLSGTLSGFVATDNVTATYTRAAGETVLGGPYTISATLGPASALSNYTITYSTAAFTIGQALASVTPAAASKTYGAADPSLAGVLSGFLASDNVTAAYTRAAGETVPGGPYTISATLSPASVLGNYAITYNTAPFTIVQAASVTNVTCPASVTFTGAAQTSCTAAVSGADGFSQSLTVNYASNTNAGTATATASYGGDANHLASTGSATFTIAQATSATVMTCPASVTFSGSAQTSCTALVTGAGGLSQSLTVNYASNINAGTATATASYGGDANHVASTGSAAFTIAQATSATLVTCPASVTYSGTPLTPCAATVTGAGGLSQSLTVTYTSDTIAGTATANASYSGDANHVASTGSAAFTVVKAMSATAVTCPATTTYSGSAQVPCTAIVTGVNGLDQSLTVSYTGNTNAGTATASASYSGDANDIASMGSATFAIAKAVSAVVVTCPPSVTYSGSAQTPCTAVVTGAGGLTQSLTVSYTSNTKAGTATASASYGGDVNHNASASSATFTIAKATPKITWATPAAINQGAALGATQLNAAASVPGTFVYAPPSGTVLGAGQQTLSVTFTPTDSADYTTATASVTINVNVTAGNLTITVGQTVTFNAGTIAHDVTVNGGNLILTNGTHVGGNVQLFSGSVTISGSSVGGNLQGFGGSVTIASSTITGDLQMSSGSVTISNSTVSGDMQMNGGGPFAIGPGTVIKGNLQIQAMPASSTVSTMCGAVVNNSLQVQSDAAPIHIGSSSGCAGNTIHGNVQIQSNTAPVQVFGNTVTYNLMCNANTSITGGGNTAMLKQGQCSAF